jgi:GNAT superfamily N-acetyltransferase
VRPEDWNEIKDQIMEIENSAFEEGVRQSEEDLGETFTYERAIGLVVLKKGDGKIVGYTVGAPLEWYSYLDFDECYGKRNSFYIESTAVLPTNQGKGIGKLMEEILIEEVRKANYERITCHSTNNMIRHINEKFGFRIIGFVRKWVGNRNAWYMGLYL